MNEYLVYTPEFQFLADFERERKEKKFMGESLSLPILELNFNGEHEYELTRAEKDMFVYTYSRTFIRHSLDLADSTQTRKERRE